MLYVYVLGQDIGINDNIGLSGSTIVYLEKIDLYQAMLGL